jgi:hypothetical protein
MLAKARGRAQRRSPDGSGESRNKRKTNRRKGKTAISTVAARIRPTALK